MGSQTQDRQHLRTCTHAYMTIRRKRTTRGRRDRPQEDDRRCVTTMVEPHDAGFEASRPTIGNTQLGGFGACSPCASVTEPLDCCRSMRPKRPGAARSGGPTWRRVGGVVVPGASVVPRVSTVARRIRPRRRDGSPEWRCETDNTESATASACPAFDIRFGGGPGPGAAGPRSGSRSPEHRPTWPLSRVERGGAGGAAGRTRGRELPPAR